MTNTHAVPSRNVALVLLAGVALATAAAHRAPGTPAAVTAKLSEWKVELSEAKIAAGPVSFTVTRSEERRVGKECRFRWWRDDDKRDNSCVSRLDGSSTAGYASVRSEGISGGQ